ncbi:hypothetical protein PDUR_19870 [Paenibacillus durus]|uniref:Uncharacterized protein n=1 Tax=Paenibacillus durus TaxID=44251 RepID=A0A089HPL8_PAEDU|nr:hypothetical protein PDUR_19870 [Paenibacillus durus]
MTKKTYANHAGGKTIGKFIEANDGVVLCVEDKINRRPCANPRFDLVHPFIFEKFLLLNRPKFHSGLYESTK